MGAHPEINKMEYELLEYTAVHCDSYNVMMSLEDYGLEILVARISDEHKTPIRSEHKLGYAL